MQLAIYRIGSCEPAVLEISEAIRIHGRKMLHDIVTGHDVNFSAAPYPETVDNIIAFEKLKQLLQ